LGGSEGGEERRAAMMRLRIGSFQFEHRIPGLKIETWGTQFCWSGAKEKFTT
jgi:hypothetical protein